MKTKSNDHQTGVAAARDALAETDAAIAASNERIDEIISAIELPRQLARLIDVTIDDDADVLAAYVTTELDGQHDHIREEVQRIQAQLVIARLKAEAACRALRQIEANRRRLIADRAAKTSALLRTLLAAITHESRQNRSKNNAEFEAAAAHLMGFAGHGADPSPATSAQRAPGEIQQAPVEAQIAA